MRARVRSGCKQFKIGAKKKEFCALCTRQKFAPSGAFFLLELFLIEKTQHAYMYIISLIFSIDIHTNVHTGVTASADAFVSESETQHAYTNLYYT